MRIRLASIAVSFLLLLTITPLLALAEDLESEAAQPLFSFKTDDREPLFGDRFTLKAGYKVWIAKWQAPVALTQNGPAHGIADHPSALNGPTISGRLKIRDSEWFNSVFVSVTSIRDGFDFEERGFVGSRNHDFFTRRDTTITGGLAIWEGFGIFARYYTSDQNLTSYFNNALFTRAKRTLQGPLFGVFGTVSVSERVSVYGNLAYALFKLGTAPKPDSPIQNIALSTNSAHGYAAELGLNITGPRLWKIGTEYKRASERKLSTKHLAPQFWLEEPLQVEQFLTTSPTDQFSPSTRCFEG